MLLGHRKHGYWTVLLVIFLASCSLGIQSSTSTPGSQDSGLVLTSEPPSSSTPPPTSTPLPSPTPDLCPASASVPLPPLPGDFPAGYVEALREYLSAGGDPTQINRILQEWQALIPQGDQFAQGDVTGDGAAEVVVAFINPQSETFPPAGVLAAYTCRNGSMARLYTYVPGQGLYPSVVGIQDLTDDGLPDLVFSVVSCGAHTCMRTVHVWSWTGSDFKEQVSGDFTVPYPDFSLRDERILATTYGFGSVGAGPQRVITETWSWNGNVITQSGETVAPPNYRYHAFVDGDEALFAGNYDTAFDAYLQVLNDDTLEPWAAAYDAREERLWLEALAQWRLMALGMELGNFPDAESRYQVLQQDYSPQTPGYPVAQMAQHFWQQYNTTGTVADGCRAAISAPEVEAVLQFLNSFGYANPTYSKEDLCPFRGS
ncbi:MAG: hypothetical protein ACP5GX_01330 [Anaerolineae bacterium]